LEQSNWEITFGGVKPQISSGKNCLTENDLKNKHEYDSN
jgi:hypothetical protein